MSKPIPIFRSQEEKFQADACKPLVDAVNLGKVRLEALVHGHYPGRPLPKGALPGVKTIGYWDADGAQDWGLPPHCNEGVEVMFLESGKLSFEAAGHEHLLKPNALTITRPWQRHRVGNPNIGTGKLHWVILDVGVRRPNQPWKWPAWILLTPADLDELTNILRHNEKLVWVSSGELRRCFQAIAHAVASDRYGSSLSRLAVRVNELLLLLLDMFRCHDIRLDQTLSSSQRTVELFLADLRTHAEHLATDWSIEEMSETCGLGATQFIYHVRALTNMTPMQYLTHCRLENAARLLRDGSGASITDVSLECGFSSSQYFATVFHRRYGCTPREFKSGPAWMPSIPT